MIRRLFHQNNLISHFKIIHHLSGIQNLYSNYTVNNLNEDISNEILASVSQFSKTNGKHQTKRKRQTETSLVKDFKQMLQCTTEEATKIVKNNQKLISCEWNQISEIFEFLFDNGVSIKSIINNSWLLSMDRQQLENRLVRLRLLQPREINDYVPLLQVSNMTLNRLIKIYNRERSVIPEENRIYYLSKKLNVEPCIITQYLAKRIFLFEINFEMLVENLNVLQEYNIDSMKILKDAHVLRYYPKTIRERLERCKSEGKELLMPWMVRCPEETLENSLKLTKDIKRLLGERSLIEYIAQRLNCNVDEVKTMAERYPQVLRCRVGKVKSVLDYLLNEEKFQPIEILRVLRILAHSLETTKTRLNELKSLGCRPSTLTIVCRSQNEYNKFVNQWTNRREKI